MLPAAAGSIPPTCLYPLEIKKAIPFYFMQAALPTAVETSTPTTANVVGIATNKTQAINNLFILEFLFFLDFFFI
jgi:hypothetical protein